MKKVYETPIAFEEQFQANSYVAKCEVPIVSKVQGVKIGCINPKHNHKWQEFGKIWIDGDETTCTVRIHPSAKNTELAKGTLFTGGSDQPAKDAIVYSANGPLDCTVKAGQTWFGVDYYMPAFEGLGPCYGSYLDKGTIDKVVSDQLVLS